MANGINAINGFKVKITYERKPTFIGSEMVEERKIIEFKRVGYFLIKKEFDMFLKIEDGVDLICSIVLNEVTKNRIDVPYVNISKKDEFSIDLKSDDLYDMLNVGDVCKFSSDDYVVSVEVLDLA